MLKYEEKLHFDEYYRKLQSNTPLHTAIGILWGVIGYVILYFLIMYAFLYVPDFRPWSNFKTWFSLGGIKFTKADFVYFVCGLILNCYGTIRLSKITVQNHSAKSEKGSNPKCLLTNGYYAKVRHPMYGTFIILQAGFMLSLRSFVGMIVALLIVVGQYINATFEEKKQLIPILGEEYNQYSKNVRRMILTKSEIIVFAVVIILSIIGFIF